MAIPKYSEISEPVLRLLSKSDAVKMKDLITPLAEHFKLTDEEVHRMYPTSNKHYFYDRICWSLSYLFIAGLVDRPKKGIYRINAKGREMLKTPDKLIDYVERAVDANTPNNSKKKKEKEKEKEKEKGDEPKKFGADSQTPKELLSKSYTSIRENTYKEILATIQSKTPAEFEKLVVSLLQKMGYGGEIKDSGTVTKMSNDEGIDGIIKEDILGFGRIHIQAKRNKLDVVIGREDMQKFAGALAGAQSNKGVFITTSSFTKSAVEYVKKLNGSPTIILMDGQELAKYMYDYGLGVQVKEVFEVKELDSDFWDNMKDDEKS